MITAGGVTVELELGLLGAEHLDQRVVDDLDDLLAGRDRAQHLLADRLLGRLVDELADHRQRDVGLEQGDPDLAHRRAHVGLVQRAAAAQAVEDAAQAIAQAFEHPLLLTCAPNAKTPAGETSPASARPWTLRALTRRSGRGAHRR